jgi:hypothetical protein
MNDLSRTAVLASDDPHGAGCDDLVTLERRTSRQPLALRPGRLLWAGVLAGAVLGAAASLALMRDEGEWLDRVVRSTGVTIFGQVETGRVETALPPAARLGPVQVADASWSEAPPKLSAFADGAPPTVPDHVDATSGLKRGEDEFAGSPLQGFPEAPNGRNEREEHLQDAAPDASALIGPVPAAPGPVDSSALPEPNPVPPASAEAGESELSSTPPARMLSPAETRGFLDRASERLRVGDIGGARRLLEYAGSGEGGEAVLLLAKTYDPAALAGWGARSVRPDSELARELYQRALELGMTDAHERLAALPPPP